MDKGIEPRAEAPLIHGRMIYRCEQCGRSWPMYLEKGIEEFGENHKPSPFTIECPYCGGWAMDISGIQKIPGGGYIPLPDGASYFANVENRDCGVPAFPVREAEGEWIDYSAEKVTAALINIIQAMSEELMPCKTLDMCAAIDEYQEQCEPLDFKTALDRKKEREKRRAVEQETASRFRQCKTRESAWVARKKTRPRQREWRGPWREEKN